MWESVLFWLFGGAAVVLGILVISLKNPVHCAVALVGNMFSLAALFAVLDAHFLAVLQVLVYAGAIMVLILFVIMLLNLKPDELGGARQTATKVVGGVLVAWVAVLLITNFAGVETSSMPPIPESYGTIETVGRLIFSTYLLPFEVASILLLAAILGAVGIAKKNIW
jgi:NADH-quinone oxidoreductase subunit J